MVAQILNPEVRQQILIATQQFVRAQGVSGVRMDDVAQGLRISKKTLYRHFRSKDRLLMAMLEAMHADYRQQFRTVLSDEKLTFRAHLHALLRLHSQLVSQLRVEVLQDMHASVPCLHARHEQLLRESMHRNFRELLVLGQQEGTLRQDLRLDIVLDMLVSATIQCLSYQALQQPGYTAEETTTTFFNLVFEGIATT